MSDQSLKTAPVEGVVIIQEQRWYPVGDNEGLEFLNGHIDPDFLFHVKVKDVQQTLECLFGNVAGNQSFLE